MTKNRKAKHAARALKDLLGGSYTHARRTLDTAHADTAETGAGGGETVTFNTSSPESKAALGPFALQFGSEQEGRPAYLNLGGDNHPPFTWVCGTVGTGKTVLANQIALAFLDQSTDAEVLWVNAHAAERLYWPATPTRFTALAANDPRVATLIGEAMHRDAPTLVVVDGASFILDGLFGESPAWAQDNRAALERVALQGRSRNVRVLLTSQQPPTEEEFGHYVVNAIHQRLLVGKTSPSVFAAYFDTRDSDVPDAVTRLPHGYGWVQYPGVRPEGIKFPDASFNR